MAHAVLTPKRELAIVIFIIFMMVSSYIVGNRYAETKNDLALAQDRLEQVGIGTTTTTVNPTEEETADEQEEDSEESNVTFIVRDSDSGSGRSAPVQEEQTPPTTQPAPVTEPEPEPAPDDPEEPEQPDGTVVCMMGVCF